MIDTITLNGNYSSNERISFITTLLNNAESKINHFDGIRQRNLVVAIAVFSGLSGFVLNAKSNLAAISFSIAILVVIGIFFILDRRFRKYSQGWQKTRKHFINAIEKVMNSPESDASFPSYDETGEKENRLCGVIIWLYVALFVGSVMAYIVYRFLPQNA
jgi:hypothetical protein